MLMRSITSFLQHQNADLFRGDVAQLTKKMKMILNVIHCILNLKSYQTNGTFLRNKC